jgi:hypothetical protein
MNMEYMSEEHAQTARKLMEEGSVTFRNGGGIIDLKPLYDKAAFEKPERVRIGCKGEYGRRLKVIETSKGPREYHVTKGWRN